MTLFAHILLALALTFFIFAYSLYLENKKGNFHQTNALLFISFGLFFLVNSLMALANNQNEAKLYSRFLFTSHFVVPLIFEILYSISEIKLRVSKLTRRLILFSPFIVMAFLDLFLPELTFDLPKLTKYGWVYVNKNEAAGFLIYNIIYIVAVLGILSFVVYLFFNTKTKTKKNFLLLFLISYLSPMAIFIALNYFFREGTVYNIPFLTFSGITGFGFILFFIKRYSVFDISLEIATYDILSNISNMMFLLDENGYIVETNKIAQNILQLSKNKNNNIDFSSLVKGNIKIEKIIEETENGKGYRAYLNGQNIAIPVMLHASRVSRKGLFLGFAVIASDISGEQRLNDEKRIYELEIKAMQSQMNSNFIFSSLSSVNNVSDKGDDKYTRQYISKLADLFKMVLEQTGEHLITVEEEIDILETYLQIEKQRFEKEFSYEIQVDEDCEAYLFEIPPMIVQPFVENAIWHGLYHSDNERKLTISFTGNEEECKIVIKDNGVGISPVRSKNSDINHRSIATIRERLDLYNKYSNGYSSSLSIENNKDIDPSSTGTTVTIEFKKELKLVENLSVIAN